MPQVPTYGDRQVRTAPLQPVPQNTPDVSSGAQALARGLGAIGEAADRIDLRDAQDAAFKAEAQIREDWAVQRAALRRQYAKDNADQYKAAADAWWEEARKRYTTELNPRAQALAGRSIGQFKLAQDADTLDYVTREKAAAREINFKTLQSTLTRETLQDATPETAGARASAAAARLRENAIRYAASEGLSSDVGEALAREQIDTMHKAMAISLASRPDGLEAARAYLAENGKDMAPGDRDAVNRQIEVTAKQAKAEREAQASDTAWQLFAQGKPIPADVLGQMDGKERVQLQEAARTRADRLAAGRQVKTDWATYLDLREKLARGERVDLRGYIERIAPAQLEQLVDIQTTAAKTGPKQDTMLTDEGRINNALVGLGIDKKKQPEAAAQLTGEIDRRVRAASAAKGRDLMPDEKQAIVDRVVLDKVYVDEWGTDPQKPVALLTSDEQQAAYVRVNGKNVPVASVPATDRRKIIQALQATGQTPTEQAIVEMYLAAQQKKAQPR